MSDLGFEPSEVWPAGTIASARNRPALSPVRSPTKVNKAARRREIRNGDGWFPFFPHVGLPMRRMDDILLNEGADEPSWTMAELAVRFRLRLRQTVKSTGRDVNRQARGFARDCDDRPPTLQSGDKSVTLRVKTGCGALPMYTVSMRSEQG